MIINLHPIVVHGAELLLTGPSPAARHIIASSFDNHGRGKQLVSGLFSTAHEVFNWN